ncbi:MAG: hypothetical protein AB7U73_22530, partial [Pirellulales bacterium]
FLQTGRGIAFNELFVMRDYPSDVMPLYSQGYSLCRFLIEQGGPRKFVAFLVEGMNGDRWNEAVNSHYGFASLGQLQSAWLEWVRQGSPALESDSSEQEPGVTLASATQPSKSAPTTADASASPPEPIYRAQSSDTPVPAPAAPQTSTIAAAATPAAPASELAATGPIPPTVGPQAIAASPAGESPSRWRTTAAMAETEEAASRSTPGWRSRGWRAGEDVAGPGPVATHDEQITPEMPTAAASRAQAPATASSQPPRRVLLEWSRPNPPGERVAANRPVVPPPRLDRDPEAEVESRVRPLYFDARPRGVILR